VPVLRVSVPHHLAPDDIHRTVRAVETLLP
jgi:hypothetical protein